MAERQAASSVRVGRGRSAVVHAVHGADGRVEARKVFVPETVSDFVFQILDGASNPYGWCRAAVETALLRRRILAPLVQHWFRARLRLPATHGAAWNKTAGAFELRMEFVRGRHAPLLSGGTDEADDVIDELVTAIMHPLQQHLRESGFDGLVWQAGLGNPVAAGNFMLAGDDAGARPRCFVWVDLESGVPALFPLDPRALVAFYLPRSLRLRRPLFDDVDVGRLRAYLLEHADALGEDLGEVAVQRLVDDTTRLAAAQSAWKRLSRTERGVRQWLVQGRIAPDRAAWYRAHPGRWTLHVAACGGRRVLGAGLTRVRRVTQRIFAADWCRVARNAACFVVSERYRARRAQAYAARRIRAWRRRGFLTVDESRLLRREVQSEATSAYLTDFGVHLLVKPFVKGLQYGVLPLAYSAGLVDAVTLAIVLVAGGSIIRTAYTLGRSLQAVARGVRPPWLALGVGALPVVGNAAYPLELVRQGYDRSRRLGGFLLYDGAATFGRLLPIWGGPDTLTEHAFNRLPRRLGIGGRARSATGVASATSRGCTVRSIATPLRSDEDVSAQPVRRDAAAACAAPSTGGAG